MSDDEDAESSLLTPTTESSSNPLNETQLAVEASQSETDPGTMKRGAEAQVPQLALDATSDDQMDQIWSWVGWLLKINFTLGMAPSLWGKPVEESPNKTVRARRRLVDLFSLPNVAIASHYWNIGLAMSFLSTPISYYLVDSLDASAAIVNQYGALTYLPWCLKVFMGLFSDSVPVMSQHRKPYFILGWLMFVVSCLLLAIFVEPNVAEINIFSFTMVFGYLVSDVVSDALVVERSVYESEQELGLMRTEGYIIRSVGGITGAVLGAILYNKSDWGWGLTIGQCCVLQAAIPCVTLLPLTPWLLDTGGGYQEVWASVTELWDLVQRRTVWWPMTFVYIYSFLQVSNPVWTNYLVEGLGFDNWELGVITIASSVFSWVSLYIYKEFFFGVNWQLIYYFTTAVNFVLSCMQLLLVFGLTGDIPKLVFAVGDYAFIAFAMYMQFMPMVVVALAVIPGGIEGASFAMLTTWMNVAGEVGYDIGTTLTGIWSVGNCKLAKGKIGGLWKLTLLTSCIQLSPVLLIWMFPKDKAAVFESLRDEVRSARAGTIFVFVLFASILASLAYSIYIIEEANDDDDAACQDDDFDDVYDDDTDDAGRRLLSSSSASSLLHGVLFNRFI